jgi:hypothetical protein
MVLKYPLNFFVSVQTEKERIKNQRRPEEKPLNLACLERTRKPLKAFHSPSFFVFLGLVMTRKP